MYWEKKCFQQEENDSGHNAFSHGPVLLGLNGFKILTNIIHPSFVLKLKTLTFRKIVFGMNNIAIKGVMILSRLAVAGIAAYFGRTTQN